MLSLGSECHSFIWRSGKFDDRYESRVLKTRMGWAWSSGAQGSSGTSARYRSILIHATDFSQVLKVPLLVSGSAFAMFFVVDL